MEGICDYLSGDHTAAFGASQDREGTADHPALEGVLEEK